MPTLCMVLLTFIWGASYIFIKISLQEMSPSMFLFWRFVIASVCVLPIFAFYKPNFKRLDVIRGSLLGVLLIGVNFFQTIGMQTIGASLSAFLTGISIVFVLLIKLTIHRQVPHWADLILVCVCVTGLGLATGSAGATWEIGVFYTLLSALFVAVHTYVLSDYAPESDVVVLTLLQMLVLAINAGFLALILDGEIYMPVQFATWGALLLCAVLCSTVAFGLQVYAQQHLSAFQASVILTLEPIFTILLARFTLHEVLYPQFYVGAGLILGAILLMNVRLTKFG